MSQVNTPFSITLIYFTFLPIFSYFFISILTLLLSSDTSDSNKKSK